MTKEFKTLADKISVKLDELADMLEDMVYMVENEDESLEGSGIDLQQISECLEDTYCIREVFDAVDDLTITKIHTIESEENPIVSEDDNEILFADGSRYRKFPYGDSARLVK